MKITENVLKELGFIQQNPPNIWDYQFHGGGIGNSEKKCRMYKSKDDWHLIYGNNRSALVTSVMGMIEIVAVFARDQGANEIQEKLFDALGIEQKIEKIIYNMQRSE